VLTQSQFTQLHQSVGPRRVLSLYIEARDNPAEKHEWRVRLRHMKEALRDDQGPDQRASIDQAFALLDDELDALPGQLPRPGWVGFATAGDLLYAGPAPAPVPDLLRWDDGIHVGPYVRALKQSRVVRAVLADHAHTRIFRYRVGQLEEEGVLEAGHTSHRGDFGASKRASTSSGMRGQARTDSAQRVKEVSTERMTRETVERLAAHRDDDGLLIVGGNLEVAADIMRSLPDRQRERAIQITDLRVDASDQEIREAIERAASTLSARLQDELVNSVLDTARSDGRACMGPERVDRALAAGAVDLLIISRAFSRTQPDIANSLYRKALDQAGGVEEIGGAAGETLDGEGGVAARLRFAV